MLPTLVRLAASIRAVRTGVAVDMLMNGDESVGGALLYKASFRGDGGLEGFLGFLCRSGDCSLEDPMDDVDFFLLSAGRKSCVFGVTSGKSLA